MKNESQKLLWLGATIAAPSSGTCSAPDTCMRKYVRRAGLTTPLTTAYSGRDTPFSRARRCASSFVMARQATGVSGGLDLGYGGSTGPDEGALHSEHPRQDHRTSQEGGRRPDRRRVAALRGPQEERKGEEKEKLAEAQDRVEEKARDVADLERRT